MFSKFFVHLFKFRHAVFSVVICLRIEAQPRKTDVKLSFPFEADKPPDLYHRQQIEFLAHYAVSDSFHNSCDNSIM